jgi:uncharacterized protein
MTGASARYGTAFLGIALALYAVAGIVASSVTIPKTWEILLGPLTGAVTGVITAATGVFVLPMVPYLHAMGLGKEELVQALGLSFTVSTVALAVNVIAEGGLNVSVAATTIAALAVACLEGCGLDKSSGCAFRLLSFDSGSSLACYC